MYYNIHKCGSLSKTPRRVRKVCYNYLVKNFHRVLGSDASKVKKIQIVYRSRKQNVHNFAEDFQNGFSDMFRNGVVTFYIPTYARMWPSYFLGHELHHLKQILRGDLKQLNTKEVLWRGRKYRFNDKYNNPWEVDAKRRHHLHIYHSKGL